MVAWLVSSGYPGSSRPVPGGIGEAPGSSPMVPAGREVDPWRRQDAVWFEERKA
jgi:hypothetical protein